MEKRPWLAAVLIFLPVLVGALTSALAQAYFQPVTLLVFKIDVGMVAFLFGAFLSLLIAVILGTGQRERTIFKKKLEDSLREVERGQRRFLRRRNHEVAYTAALNFRSAFHHGERIRRDAGFDAG